MLALILATLVLVAASPLQERAQLLPRAETIQMVWRGNGKKIATCSGGGPNGPRNGDPLTLLRGGVRYCGTPWTRVGQTYQSGYADGPFLGRCIDSTLDLRNGVRPHMWDCIPGAFQQQWVQHSNGWIELKGHGLCLDVVDGNSDNGIQLWECSEGNINQQWDVGPFVYSLGP
ncbi:hypothetical protein CspeluHIS016_0900410 [Cutaneotrichosporon spelunceum]|uniref:Ricin B lectin domain-containing protein n=1 Tax=Cutaneotrichosporon spelunceum TaxID=1672016 RepID=A0AAD3U087_9TREE|nr:hypothetical protein CspeluHIS016_0900410 [Cutaneotrichosporon spelunceum]